MLIYTPVETRFLVQHINLGYNWARALVPGPSFLGVGGPLAPVDNTNPHERVYISSGWCYHPGLKSLDPLVPVDNTNLD
jgi:hypothetical protein